MSVAAALPPYARGRAGRRLRPFSLAFMLLYSALTGALVALLPAQLLFLLAVPLGVAVIVVLLLLPDGGVVPFGRMATLLVWFVAATVLWPNYISLDLPGLPWINPPRIAVFALLAIGLFSYATSAELRSEIATVLRVDKFLIGAFWVFWATTTISIVLSPQIPFSLNKWLNNQIYWTFLFIFAAWLGTKGQVIERVVKVILWTTIVVAIETIYEYHIGQVPWMNYIPSFLNIDQGYLVNVLKAQSRAGTDIYRAHGTFTVSLVCAEYFAIVYPLLIHAMVSARNFIERSLLLFGLTAVLVAMWLTNARSAMIGFFLAVFVYGSFAAFRYWRRNRQSLMAISTLVALPVIALSFLALSLTWNRLHVITFGGGQHQASSEARATQWAMGTPKIKANPIGHGPGEAGQVLGYANLGGQLTIDTYYLSLLIEYGIVGFGAFLAIFSGQLIVGLRVYLNASPGEESLAGPIAIALLNFLVIKAVLSSEFNMPLAFIFLGFLFAIAWRQQQRMAGASVAAAAVPARGRVLAAA